MAPDGITRLWTGLQRPHGKGLAEVDEPGTARPWALGNPGGRAPLGKRVGAHGP